MEFSALSTLNKTFYENKDFTALITIASNLSEITKLPSELISSIKRHKASVKKVHKLRYGFGFSSNSVKKSAKVLEQFDSDYASFFTNFNEFHYCQTQYLRLYVAIKNNIDFSETKDNFYECLLELKDDSDFLIDGDFEVLKTFNNFRNILIHSAIELFKGGEMPEIFSELESIISLSSKINYHNFKNHSFRIDSLIKEKLKGK